MVVAIMGFVAAIAAPRFSSASQQASLRQLHANTSVLQRAIDRYTAEHGGLTPAHASDGSIDVNGTRFKARLLRRTDVDGTVNVAAGECGPYLREFPGNPFATGNVVRIDGAGRVSGAAWYFSSALYTIRADHDAYEIVDLYHGGKGGKLVVPDEGVKGLGDAELPDMIVE